jgi:hypothetical protein
VAVQARNTSVVKCVRGPEPDQRAEPRLRMPTGSIGLIISERCYSGHALPTTLATLRGISSLLDLPLIPLILLVLLQKPLHKPYSLANSPSLSFTVA